MAASLAPDAVVDAERVTTPKRRIIYLVMLLAAVAAIYGVFESGGIQGTEAALRDGACSRRSSSTRSW